MVERMYQLGYTSSLLGGPPSVEAFFEEVFGRGLLERACLQLTAIYLRAVVSASLGIPCKPMLNEAFLGVDPGGRCRPRF
jgi:hypothetical protein